MRRKSLLPRTLFAAIVMAGGAIGADDVCRAANPPRTVRDVMWAWGNPEMVKPGPHTVATFAEASPAQRAQLLGVPNIVMAGQGLPNDEAKADALTKEVADSKRLISAVRSGGEDAVQCPASQ
jgi:hypothetical protein